jgi:hypothetical protein
VASISALSQIKVLELTLSIYVAAAIALQLDTGGRVVDDVVT